MKYCCHVYVDALCSTWFYQHLVSGSHVGTELIFSVFLISMQTLLGCLKFDPGRMRTILSGPKCRIGRKTKMVITGDFWYKGGQYHESWTQWAECRWEKHCGHHVSAVHHEREEKICFLNSFHTIVRNISARDTMFS